MQPRPGTPAPARPGPRHAPAKYGACRRGDDIFVGRSPFDDDTLGHLSYWKYVIAHEFGHLVSKLLIRHSTDGGYGASSSITGLFPMCVCDHVTSANPLHCFQSLEDIGSALTEGWAQFYAAKAFNYTGEGDCTFVYYKEYRTGPNPADPVLTPPVPLGCQTPLRLKKNYCDVAVPNEYDSDGGIEGDWMNFLWRAHEDSANGSTMDDLRTILASTFSDGDFIKTAELAPAASAHFGAGAKATHFSQSATNAGID